MRQSSSRHPGWPAHVGNLRVAAGVVSLRPVRWRDSKPWSALRTSNEDQLRPWEPTATGDWALRHQPGNWFPLYNGLRSEARRGAMIPLVIEVDGQYRGQLTIGNIVRGPLQSAWIGYWVDKQVTGGGVATAALALGVDHCFGPAGLHRVEATVRPGNAASRAVLAKAGFREEGMLTRYLDIDGAWRDHILVAMTIEELGTPVAARLCAQGRASWA